MLPHQQIRLSVFGYALPLLPVEDANVGGEALLDVLVGADRRDVGQLFRGGRISHAIQQRLGIHGVGFFEVQFVVEIRSGAGEAGKVGGLTGPSRPLTRSRSRPSSPVARRGGIVGVGAEVVFVTAFVEHSRHLGGRTHSIILTVGLYDIRQLCIVVRIGIQRDVLLLHQVGEVVAARRMARVVAAAALLSGEAAHQAGGFQESAPASRVGQVAVAVGSVVEVMTGSVAHGGGMLAVATVDGVVVVLVPRPPAAAGEDLAHGRRPAVVAARAAPPGSEALEHGRSPSVLELAAELGGHRPVVGQRGSVSSVVVVDAEFLHGNGLVGINDVVVRRGRRAGHDALSVVGDFGAGGGVDSSGGEVYDGRVDVVVDAVVVERHTISGFFRFKWRQTNQTVVAGEVIVGRRSLRKNLFSRLSLS
mmetsp:Transcript_36668/g.67974  ORF Transcript_36668/g.67974 Transcript_36668/m.67974 type:complete len:419 (-) Transcript_36668:57-1313(-)